MHPLVIIFSFIIVATIISFAFGSVIHKRQIAYKERKEALDRESRGADPAGSAKKVEKLEQRVRVLERLATDRSPDLASQIEDLRGLPDTDLTPSEAEKVQ
jgi:hypothetical protein